MSSQTVRSYKISYFFVFYSAFPGSSKGQIRGKTKVVRWQLKVELAATSLRVRRKGKNTVCQVDHDSYIRVTEGRKEGGKLYTQPTITVILGLQKG